MAKKKTHEEFVDEVFNKYNGEYEVVGQYLNNQTSVNVKHMKCGHIRLIKPSTILFKSIQCPKCETVSKYNKFIKEFQSLSNSEYKIIGEFKSLTTKLLIKHNKCEYEYLVTPKSFLEGKRCPKCAGKMKKTNDQFKKELYDLYGDEYIALDEYNGAEGKIKVKHVVCGSIYETTPHSILRGYGCRKCCGKMKLTTEEFKRKISDITEDEYTVIGNYINTKTKILIKHNNCGNEYYITPNMFLNGFNRCKECATYYRSTNVFKEEVFKKSNGKFEVLSEFNGTKNKCTFKHLECGRTFVNTAGNFIASDYKHCPLCDPKKKRTHEEFKEEFDDMSKGHYELIGTFEKLDKKVEVKHNVCGKTFYIAPHHFFNGRGCPHCFKKERKTTKQFKQEANDATSGEYSVLSEYKNAMTKILIRHNKCGHEWKVVPNKFLHSNSRCPMCSSTARKTQEKFEQEVFDLVGNEYAVLSDYINSNEHIKMKHNSCGHVWNITPASFLSGTRCPVCAESKGEQSVRQWLTDHSINFIAQYKYHDLIGTGGGLLSYDFYLPDHNLLIEYQGEFHDGKRNNYVKVNLETQKEHDRRKKEYAKQHNIALLEIWYWDFDNIDIILNKELSNLIPQPM